MQKRIWALLVAFGIFALLCFGVSGAELPDGIYEVPVTMLHAKKDKTSMGNKYIEKTALLEVIDGQKTLTVVTDSSVGGLRFWYYTNGSVEGETADATEISDVEIGGIFYPSAFCFPLVGGGSQFGVKFSASIMPMSPSARIAVDFEKAKLVTPFEAESTTQEATTENIEEETTVPPSTQSPMTTERTLPSADEETAPESAQPNPSDILLHIGLCFGIISVIVGVFMVIHTKRGMKHDR